jgi:GTPase SAR1 family protein
VTDQAAQRSEPAAATLPTLLERTRLLADSLGREDLAHRLGETRKRVAEPGVRVLVVGEFKQGKSTLVNEVLGRVVCPVDDDVATAVLTHVRYSPETWGKAFRTAENGAGAEVEPIDPAGAAMYVSELGNPSNEKELLRVEFGLPSSVLKQGMILIDTPGVGGLESAHGFVTIGALAQADAVLFVTDASQELSGPELGFLKHAHELCPTVIHVVTKIDLYPEWGRVMELSRGHIEKAGLEGPVMGVSCSVHNHSRKVRDSTLAEESGFPALLKLLRDEVVAPGARVVARAALREAQSSLDQLLAPLDSERATLEDPERGEKLLAEYEEAQRLAEQLQTQAARWQVTLNDGIGDLNATVDHDLRAATRSIIAEGEAVIDAGDPADFWQEFQADIYAKMTAGIVENFSLLTSEVTSLVETVETHFAVAEDELSESFEFAAPITQLKSLEIDDSNVKLDREGLLSKGFSGIKGGYTGVLMLTFGGGLIGLGAIVIAPVGIMAGVMMGRKVVKTERDRVLLTSRQQAKQALRKYVDEVLFQVAKESRDSLRDVQKELRDLFTARATELTRSTKEGVARTQQALNADTASKTSRLQELNSTIDQIQDVQRLCGETFVEVEA